MNNICITNDNRNLPHRNLPVFLSFILYSLSFSPVSLADPFSFDFEHEDFKLVPVRAMSNEQLFSSAKSLRNERTSMKHIQLNTIWLSNYQKEDYSGSSAAKKAIKLIFKSWQNNYLNSKHLGPRSYTKTGGLKLKNNFSEFQDIENYRLNVSDDKFRLRFTHPF